MGLSRLSELPLGGCGSVTAVEDGLDIVQRLRDLGFTRGAEVKCLFAAPMGELRAYLVRGGVMALRRADAALVLLGEDGGC